MLVNHHRVPRPHALVSIAIFALAPFLAPPPAAAQPSAPEPRIDGDALTLSSAEAEPQTVPLSCEGLELRVLGDRVYVACPREIVVVHVAEEEPRVESRLSVAGEIVRLLEIDGRLWVETRRRSAEPLSQIARAGGVPLGHAETPPTVASAPHPSPSDEAAGAADADALGRTTEPAPEVTATREAMEAARTRQVSRTDDGDVVVGLGRDHGLEIGSRVELYVSEEQDFGDGHMSRQERRIAVGEVSSVGSDRATVTLGLGEEIPDDVRARVTDVELTRSLIAPPRIGGTVSAAVVLRPLLPIDDLGLLLFSDIRLTYRGDKQFFIRGELDPIGYSAAEGPNQWIFGARALGGYDHPLFGVGLGFGAARVEDSFFDDDSAARFVVDGVAFTIDQYVRIGAIDGLHIEIANGFALEHGIFRWARTRGAIQVPLTSRVWLRAEGGDGHTGLGWGEIGVRYLAKGDGRSGSLFILGSAGGGAFFYGPRNYAGAHVGGGLELRL